MKKREDSQPCPAVIACNVVRVSSLFGGDGGAGEEGAPFPKSNLSKDKFRILKHTKDQTQLSERIIREKSRWVDFSCG